MNEFVNTMIKGLLFENPIFLTIIIGGILSAIFYNKIAGFMGEFWVKSELKKLPKDKYKILNNIMIKINEKTYQIDHIVISLYGIFVIETKNYDGLITGNYKSDKWCMHLGKNKYYFYNPIHQNYGHIKALEQLLGINESKFISIISMSNRAKIKVDAKNVVNLDYLLDAIKKYQDITLDVNIEELVEKINVNNITDKEARKKHVKNIKQDVKNKKEQEDNMICPRCKSQLVVRNGKNGEFIGCSNYPKCKYTKKL